MKSEPVFLPIAEARKRGVQTVTVPDLRRRNPAWTPATIKRLLGAPDALMHNPCGGRMRVYFLNRVEAAEAELARVAP